MSDTLIIKPGGKLISKYWFYDEEVEVGKYVYEDVTHTAITRLFDKCILDEQVILRDVFLLLNTNLPVFDMLIGNWCKQYVCEGLQETDKTSDSEIHHLELYWYAEEYGYDEGSEFEGLRFPDFHGIGDEHNYDISLTKADNLAFLPLKLNDQFTIVKDSEVTYYKSPEFTLGQILYGIIWELSFYGDPDKRDRRLSELHEASKEIPR
jgi:hypothetical protein